MQDILSGREQRSNLINQFNKPNELTISIKANMPSGFKNVYEAYFLVDLFTKILHEKLVVLRDFCSENSDGYFKMISVSGDILQLKICLIKLEEAHPLGRYIDIDITDANASLTRCGLGRGLRKCFICDDKAIVCMRLNRHTNLEVYICIKNAVRDYLFLEVKNAIIYSIKAELNIPIKYGLVTPISVGSHADMDFSLMTKSYLSFVDILAEMFLVGLDGDDLTQVFIKGRELGLQAENLMLKATSGINTYKGLIFLLGSALLAAGYVFKHNKSIDDVFKNVAVMCNGIDKELNEVNTAGSVAYKKHGFLGARGEAIKGLPTVKTVYNFLKNNDNNDLIFALIESIKYTDDTVLLKRVNFDIDKYSYFKNLVLTKETFLATEECIKNNVSFGGSADILITAIFLTKMF